MGNSSSTASSSTTNGEQYDVFISFRGEDTRNGFTGHLYRALNEKQIKTFRDDQLVRGEKISEGLLSVIRESKISVVIFSENYASSKWCLLELAEIMKYVEKKKQIVIPVFYKVKPSDVRKSYEAAFAKHTNEWRPALTEASKISGIVIPKGRDESELVCNIVGDVWNQLYNISPSCDFEDLVKDYVGIEKYVGIDKHIMRVVSLLGVEMQDFRIIGIWGMGGMGKTTIADVVFHIISRQFENRTYFTSSVREKDSTGLTSLRNKILSKVLKIENIENQISDSPNIPQRFKKMLLQKKVLIVFDDVDSIKQLETLAGDLDRLGPGSRIIVTTRDKQVLRNCGVKDHNMHEVKGLNPDEALQLFCNHAFKQNHPTEDFEDLSREMVKIATDVPLAVKLLGLLLYTRSKQYWEDAVDQFQGIMNPTIFDRLKISYNGLGEEEKGLFLDIACFVDVFAIGRDVPKLLSNRMCFLDHLIDKSLVTVECGYIEMHDLLREMGMKIASENRSRLCRQEDVLHTLEHNDGTNAVQGIFLSMFDLKDECLSFQALMKMNNLTTLIIIGGQGYQCYGGLDYLPNKLRYLHWKSCTLEVLLPSSFNPMNLVELDLSYSKIKQLWEGSTWVPKLKWLNLYCCENLISIPDLSNIPSAEIINLKYCTSLIEIHSSRECPKNLHSLQLEGCGRLSSFPKNIHLSEKPSFSTSVVLHSSREGLEFSIHGCFSLTQFPDISGNIKTLDLSFSRVKEVPSTIQIPSKLESLNMSNCTRLKSISESICKLKSLVRLDLSGCCKLESFPDILEGMELKHLNLSGTAIKELPPSIGNLNRLEELVLSGCKNLKRFPSSICKLKSLVRLDLRGCCKLESFPNILEGMELKYLNLSGTPIKELPPSIGNLNRLEELVLSGCKKLETFPSSICKLKSLVRLDLRGCCKLESFPDILEGMELKYLNLSGTAIKELPPSIGNLNRLEELVLSGCKNLETFTSSICKLKSLVRLDLSGCKELESFPDILEGMELKYLNLRETAIKELPPSIGNLNQLEELVLRHCKNLETFPSSICKLKSLVRLNLSGCCKLESFPDILEGMELKYLDLSGTAIKEPPPSIGNLNRLEELDSSDCSKPEKLPPLSGLCSLKKLRLNNSNLTEISEDIGCLSLLEKLELDGNVFERLPKSIKQLSKLYYLSLNNCRMLQSLPELPSSLRYLEAMNCKELFQSLPDESEYEFCPNGSGSFYFNFLNCLKLNQKAVSNLLIFFRNSLQKMQGMGTEKIISLFKVSLEVTSQLPPSHRPFLLTPDEKVKGSICLPGSEIPEWFGCYTNIGSSINNIPVLRNDCARSRYIMGFEVCLVIGAVGYKVDLASSIDVCYDFQIETSDGHKEVFFRNSIQLSGRPVFHSDHILLGYILSRKCYEFFQELDSRLANRGMSDYVGTSFEFSIRNKDVLGNYNNLSPGCKVKYCGILPIYVPFIDFVSINQDIGETSGRNDITEETCEPHPKRICTEANQCSTTHGL